VTGRPLLSIRSERPGGGRVHGGRGAAPRRPSQQRANAPTGARDCSFAEKQEPQPAGLLVVDRERLETDDERLRSASRLSHKSGTAARRCRILQPRGDCAAGAHVTWRHADGSTSASVILSNAGDVCDSLRLQRKRRSGRPGQWPGRPAHRGVRGGNGGASGARLNVAPEGVDARFGPVGDRLEGLVGLSGHDSKRAFGSSRRRSGRSGAAGWCRAPRRGPARERRSAPGGPSSVKAFGGRRW
jgi:hypothetical protein